MNRTQIAKVPPSHPPKKSHPSWTDSSSFLNLEGPNPELATHSNTLFLFIIPTPKSLSYQLRNRARSDRAGDAIIRRKKSSSRRSYKQDPSLANLILAQPRKKRRNGLAFSPTTNSTRLVNLGRSSGPSTLILPTNLSSYLPT